MSIRLLIDKRAVMTLTITETQLDLFKKGKKFSYSEAKQLKEEITWRQLQKVTVEEALNHWFKTLSPLTAQNYRSGIGKLVEFRILEPFTSLQAFSLANADAVIDQIKQIKQWSENTKQARAAAFISFTRFLSRRTNGMIKKATPSKEGTSKTFFRVHEKVTTNAMSQAQWIRFFEELERINSRDCLIAKILLQGGKRVNEVLNLTSDRIDYSRNQITFAQSKTKGLVKETVITYPSSIMEQLKQYLDKREGAVFITRTRKSVGITQLAGNFARAGQRAGIPFKITPHVLRASAVTYLKGQGFQDSEIMKVTGHASSSMVNAYDKSERANNPSKQVALVS